MSVLALQSATVERISLGPLNASQLALLAPVAFACAALRELDLAPCSISDETMDCVLANALQVCVNRNHVSRLKVSMALRIYTGQCVAYASRCGQVAWERRRDSTSQCCSSASATSPASTQVVVCEPRPTSVYRARRSTSCQLLDSIASHRGTRVCVRATIALHGS